MKYVLLLSLFLVGCVSAPVEVHHFPNVRFIEVDYMKCLPVSEVFPKNRIPEDWMLKIPQCSVTYDKVRIQKDRIRAYHSQYSSTFTIGSELIELDQLNVEHCRIYLAGPGEEAKPLDINMTCSRLDALM